MALRSLALCAGIGGLDLGVRLARPDHRLVGAVERQAYCAAVLVDRMGRSQLDTAPVWDDLLTFDGRAWRGGVDLVTAGFPCQPASVAGSRRGTDDDRWMWPEVWRVTGECGAGLLFVENVPGLLSVNGGRAFAEILGDLASRGWMAEWDCVPAASVGAPHRRDRLFLLAADPDRRVPERGNVEHVHYGGTEPVSPATYASSERCKACKPGPDADRTIDGGFDRQWDWRTAPEPSFRGMDDGTPHELDRDWCERIHAIGNAVVPAAAAAAWTVLWERISY